MHVHGVGLGPRNRGRAATLREIRRGDKGEMWITPRPSASARSRQSRNARRTDPRISGRKEAMTEWIKSLVREWSYGGVVFLMIIENVFPPIPSELIMPLAGFFSSTGDLLLVGVIVAGTIGSMIGALPLYYAGKVAGEKRVRRWCDRHGKWIGLSGRDVDKAGRWFERHGAVTVLFCRLVPGVRSLISVPAGVAGMSVGLFLVFTMVGSAIWTAALAFAGRALAHNYEAVEKVVGPISTAVIGGIVVFIVVRAIRERRRTTTAS
jgi:membrane protein DedA with SNARE-associated domain